MNQPGNPAVKALIHDALNQNIFEIPKDVVEKITKLSKHLGLTDEEVRSFFNSQKEVSAGVGEQEVLSKNNSIPDIYATWLRDDFFVKFAKYATKFVGLEEDEMIGEVKRLANDLYGNNTFALLVSSKFQELLISKKLDTESDYESYSNMELVREAVRLSARELVAIELGIELED